MDSIELWLTCDECNNSTYWSLDLDDIFDELKDKDLKEECIERGIIEEDNNTKQSIQSIALNEYIEELKTWYTEGVILQVLEKVLPPDPKRKNLKKYL